MTVKLRNARVPFAEYTERPATNISLLLEALVSWKQFLWRRDNPRPDNRNYRLGRLTHSAVLEPMRLLREYVVSPYENFTTKAAREWRDSVDGTGKTWITQKDMDLAEAMQRAVWAHPLARKHVLEGEPEFTIGWNCSRTGLPKKGRIDLLNGCIVDLKTTAHVHPSAFGKDAMKFNYHARMAWYQEGIQAVTGELLPVVLVAVQKTPPHEVAVYRMDEGVLELGRRVYEPLMDELSQCVQTGEWPGVCESEELPLHVPVWAVEPEDGDLLGLDLDMKGDSDDVGEKAS